MFVSTFLTLSGLVLVAIGALLFLGFCLSLNDRFPEYMPGNWILAVIAVAIIIAVISGISVDIRKNEAFYDQCLHQHMTIQIDDTVYVTDDKEYLCPTDHEESEWRGYVLPDSH